jgi:hypothetical protein
MTKKIIGLFSNPSQAEQARSEIMALNLPSMDVQVYDKAGFLLTGGTDTSSRGFWETFTNTIGFGPSNQALYQESVQRGGTVVSTTGEDGSIEKLVDILHRCGAVDVATGGAGSTTSTVIGTS